MSDDSEDCAPKGSSPIISRQEFFKVAGELVTGAYFGAVIGGSTQFLKDDLQKDAGNGAHETGVDAADTHAPVQDIGKLKEGAGIGAVVGTGLSAVMLAHRTGRAAIHSKEAAAATISKDTPNGEFQKRETAKRKERIYTKFDGLP